MALQGIRGRPFLDLSAYVDLGALAALNEEICLGLAHVPWRVTGGSHRSMGIVPPSRAGECLVDYVEVIRGMSRAERAVLASLADEPELALDASLDAALARADVGEERAVPLSPRQARWLEARYGVYFPWAAYVELVPNGRWETKAQPAGKAFTRDALLHFPRTVAFVRGLPFDGIGSVKILGLRANDHGTTHRDREPLPGVPPDPFVTICPRGDKRLFLWDEEARAKTYAPSRVYWFNDADYHGVEADPFFRYSIRVDGPFTARFASALERDFPAR